MQLTVRDVAHMLKVSENTVYSWVSGKAMPAETINGAYRFNRAEVLEWATLNHVEVSPAFFHCRNGNGNHPPTVAEALRAGGVHHGVPATDRDSALRAAIARMPLPPRTDREFLLQVFLNRELSGSTAIGDGLALPHARYPVVLPVEHPLITLCFLERPVTYGPGGREVHTLFALVSPTVRVHLGLLARLSCALHDPAFHEAVVHRAPAAAILAAADQLELEESAVVA